MQSVLHIDGLYARPSVQYVRKRLTFWKESKNMQSQKTLGPLRTNLIAAMIIR